MSTLNSITNLNSLNILNSLEKSRANIATSLQRLSSGSAINSTFDNPSGFSISERMRDYIQGLKKSSTNAQNGISYLQTAEGATNEITSMLQRMRELAVESSNGTYTSNDRQELQKEMDQLKAEINRISGNTEFNTKKILNGESSGVWNSGSNRVSAIVTGNVKDGNYNIAIDVTPGKNQVMTSQIMTLKKGKIGARIDKSDSSIVNVTNPKEINATKGKDYIVKIGDKITTGDTMELVSSYKEDGSTFATGKKINSVSSNTSGYMEIEFTKDNDKTALVGTKFKARFVSAETGEEGKWIKFHSKNQDSLEGNYVSNGFNVNFNVPVISGPTSVVKKGDKLLFAVSDSKDIKSDESLLNQGGGTVQLERDGIKGPIITYNKPNSLTKPDNNDGMGDINNVTIHTVNLNSKTGQITKGQITLGLEGITTKDGTSKTVAGTAAIEIRHSGEAATLSTKLSDISNFTDDDGNNLLETTQELKLYGNSKTATVYLDKNDSLATMKEKFTKAITKDLGLESGDAAVDSKIVDFVSDRDPRGTINIPGTLVIQSGITGEQGKISLIGNQKLITALGFQTIQKAENNITKVTLKNSRTGVIEGVGSTSGSVAKNIVKGLDLDFDSRASVSSKWNNDTKQIEFSADKKISNYNMDLHVVDDRTQVQIGTMQGETLDISLPSTDTKALGISNATITTAEDAQKAITSVDEALKKVVSIRSTIGSNVSRLESTIDGLETGVTNATASDSKIRDTDVASETSNMAMGQMMYQTDMAMLAQANQMPGMALSLLK